VSKKVMIVNLTPHDINLFRGDELVETVKSSGIARVNVRSEIIGEINGYPISKNFYGEITGLPAPQPGIYYVVSALVAQAAVGLKRTDLLVVNDTVRDEKGQIIGCRGFARI
jgi:hypothetical protein